MSNLLKSKVLPWVGGIAVVVLLALLVPPHLASSIPEKPQVLVEENIGNVRYAAGFDAAQQAVYAEVNFDYFSPEGIKEYITFNRNLSQELAQSNREQLRARVHFSRPLSQQEFEAFVERYDVEVHSYFMRAVEADGTRAGIGGAPEKGELVPQQYLASR